jgi:hypothetical protein
MPAPARINPDILLNENTLYELDQFRRFVQCIQQIPAKAKETADALKVIDCLRFIKVNESYLRYAFEHQDDRDVYLSDRDKSIKTLRDFNNIAIDLKDATTDAPLYKNANEFWEDLTRMFIQFEHAIDVARQKDKLKEFVGKLQYDELVGCIAARITGALLYAKTLETSDVPHFEECMQDLAQRFTDDSQDNYRKVYAYFKSHQNDYFRYQKSAEIQITKANIDDYMVNILGQDRLLESKEETELHENSSSSSTSIPHANHIPVRTEDEAIHLINKGNGLVKVIAATDETLFTMLNILVDPANYRPLKGTHAPKSKYWDPRDGQWHTRKKPKARGLPKPPNWTWPKKTASTLLTTNGKIHLACAGIIFLFDLMQCNLKNDKYIFPDNANTDRKWWLDDAGKRSISLDALKQQLQDFVSSGTIPAHNEILACLAKHALYGVATTQDIRENRLHAFRAKMLVKEMLNIDIPVLIITPTQGAIPYKKEVLVADLMYANTSLNSVEQQTLLSITRQPERLIQNVGGSTPDPFQAFAEKKLTPRFYGFLNQKDQAALGSTSIQLRNELMKVKLGETAGAQWIRDNTMQQLMREITALDAFTHKMELTLSNQHCLRGRGSLLSLLLLGSIVAALGTVLGVYSSRYQASEDDFYNTQVMGPNGPMTCATFSYHDPHSNCYIIGNNGKSDGGGGVGPLLHENSYNLISNSSSICESLCDTFWKTKLAVVLSALGGGASFIGLAFLMLCIKANNPRQQRFDSMQLLDFSQLITAFNELTATFRYRRDNPFAYLTTSDTVATVREKVKEVLTAKRRAYDELGLAKLAEEKSSAEQVAINIHEEEDETKSYASPYRRLDLSVESVDNLTTPLLR